MSRRIKRRHMSIKEVVRQSVWQKFFDDNGSPSFLQSWEWGNLQKSLGYGILRLGIHDNDILQTISQVVKIKSRRGSFLFIPHGPIFSQTKNSKLKMKNCLKKLKKYLVNIARKEGFSFIRIAPILEDRGEYREIFQDLGFKTAPIYMHAERVWMLLINKSENELLTNMRKTTRYLINKAKRDGVIIEKRTDGKAIDDFWKIYAETARRENFVPFSKSFIRKEFEAFKQNNRALFLYHQLGSALILFTKSTAFYHQGASIHTKIPVTYLLQWEAICEAKKRGCQFYNFWGILQEGRTPKNWEGLTLFKTGFGGGQIDYLPTQDYVISPKYYLTYLYEKILRWKRGV